MTQVNEFIELFHTLHGTNVKETWKNFNKYFTSLKSNITTEEDINNFTKMIIPNSPMDEIFRLDILIKLKRKESLIKELKACNLIAIKKLLKDWRLFGELFSKLNTDDFINNILPHLSYSLKLKILNGISKNVKNESLLDEYFTALQKKYGLRIALIILPGCSINLIKSNVETYQTKLPTSHLKSIFKKDQQFVDFYFGIMEKRYKNINLTSKYLGVIKYIARTNPDIYWKLYEKYGVKTTFGKYTTPTMLKTYKDIMKSGVMSLRMFHSLQMYKTLRKEGKLDEFLLTLYPETHDRFVGDCCYGKLFLGFIQKGSVHQWYNLISTLFKKKYNQDLLNYPEYFTQDLLKMTPVKERHIILDILVKEDEKLYYLYETAVSIPLFKERVRHTSDHKKRYELAGPLYETCLVNKDEQALLNVMQYILNRHKNDLFFISRFFDRVIEWPNVINLTEEHWECIASFHKILQTSQSVSYYNTSIYLAKYVCFLYKNGKSGVEIIKENVKDIVEERSCAFWDIKDKKYRLAYWDELASCIETYKDHKKYQQLCIQFFNLIERECRKASISLLRYDRFFDQLKSDDWRCVSVISDAVKYDNDVIHDIYWKSPGMFSNIPLLWYAKHRPEILRENIDKALTKLKLCNCKGFFMKLKRIADPYILDKITKYALDNIYNESQDKAKGLITAVSLTDPEAFLKFATPLLPKSDGKVDLEEPACKINLQYLIAKSLCNVQDPLKVFPIILKFCVGDYLKYGLTSLHSVSYNIPELLIKDYLNKLANMAVSVRKHVLLLGRLLFKAEDFYELLKEWSDAEKNLSMRNILIKKTREYLIENPSDRFWTLLKSNLNKIDAHDREMYDFLLTFEKMPLDYLPEYLQIMYRSVSGNPDNEINDKKFDLLSSIPTEMINKLDNTFLKEVIRETAFTEQTNFHWKCVFHVSKERQFELFEENFSSLRSYLQENKFGLVQNIAIRYTIKIFLLNFYNVSVDCKSSGDLIEKFTSSWTSIFQREEFNKEYLLIQFCDLFFKSNFDLYETGLKINKLFYDYINTYNGSVINSFRAQLDSFLYTTSVKQKEEELFKFFNGLYYEKKDDNIYLIMITYLPNTLPKPDNAYAKYMSMLETIEKRDTPLVRYHFDHYLNSANKY